MTVSPGGRCTKRGVQYSWPGHQGPLENIDDRSGPIITRKRVDISISCLPQARAGVQFSVDHCRNWAGLRLHTNEDGGGTCPTHRLLAHRSSTMWSDRLPTSRSG